MGASGEARRRSTAPTAGPPHPDARATELAERERASGSSRPSCGSSNHACSSVRPPGGSARCRCHNGCSMAPAAAPHGWRRNDDPLASLPRDTSSCSPEPPCGIGQAAAIELAKEGVELALAGRDPQRVNAVAQEAKAAGGGGWGSSPRARRRSGADGRRPHTGRGSQGALRADRRPGEQRRRAVRLAQGDRGGPRADLRTEPPRAVPADQPAARSSRRAAAS